MNISKKLTEKDFKEILINTYFLGEKSEDIQIKDLLKEIEQQIFVAIQLSDQTGRRNGNEASF